MRDTFDIHGGDFFKNAIKTRVCVQQNFKQRGDSQFLAETQSKNEILRLFAGSG